MKCKKIISIMLCAFLFFGASVVPALAVEKTKQENAAVNQTENGMPVTVNAKSAILMDCSTGNVLMAMNEHERLNPASVTKIMATTSLALIALDKGLLQLDDKVEKFYLTKKNLTIKNLLTHTVGIGHKALNKEGNTYDNIAEKILDIPKLEAISL